MSDIFLQTSLYEEDLNEETIFDLSSQDLVSVPDINNEFLSGHSHALVLQHSNATPSLPVTGFVHLVGTGGLRTPASASARLLLKHFGTPAIFVEELPTPGCTSAVLYLQNNKLKALPDDFFLRLPNLKWLDLRDNQLSDIPKSVKNHSFLTHILLQNNKLTTLPNELGTVMSLKVLQLSGNPLMYPPRDVIKEGTESILKFLNERFVEELLEESRSIVSDKASTGERLDKLDFVARSYNSVLDGPGVPPHKTLSVQVSEREFIDDEEESYRTKEKCPKLAKSRTKTLPPYCQSAKYVRPLKICPKREQDEKIRESLLMDAALKKQKDLIAKRDKILQDRRNIELLKNWRKNYKHRQLTLSLEDNKYKITAKSYPYDTNPEYMTLLNRDDIERDLPDKYKKRLNRKPKPTVPRRSNNDVHLAMKIKKLFENLEAIDLNRETMSPRTEQKVLLDEIQKISEIKQKLMELSNTNSRSVSAE